MKSPHDMPIQAQREGGSTATTQSQPGNTRRALQARCSRRLNPG